MDQEGQLVDAHGDPIGQTPPRNMSADNGQIYANNNTTTGADTSAFDSKDNTMPEKVHKDIIASRTPGAKGPTPGGIDDELETDEDDLGFSPAVKRMIAISCLLSLFVGNMMIFNVATLLPPYVEDNFKDELNEFDTSLIISVFSIAQIVLRPSTQTSRTSWERREQSWSGSSC